MKIGIRSSSRIIAEFFKHLTDMPFIEVTAMCVRPQSAEKARAMLDAAGLSDAVIFTDYDAFLQSDLYDAVYNGTANHLHYPETVQALTAGRHVILEKPFTITYEETLDLFRLAEEHNVMLFEAITTPYMPGFRFMKEQLAAVSPVRAAVLNFSKYSSRYDDYLAGKWNSTFDPACRGGALNDLNVYNIHLVCALFGAPLTAQYFPVVGKLGVDTGGTAMLTYPGFNAVLTAHKDSTAPFSVVIQGEKGTIESTSEANALQHVHADIAKQHVEGPVPDRFRMTYEFEAFAEAIEKNDRTAYEAAKVQTVTVMRIMDALQKAIPAYAE